MDSRQQQFFPMLRDQIVNFKNQVEIIPGSRRQLLEELATFLATKRNLSPGYALNYICTHNSRRSHIAQIWSVALAKWYGMDDLKHFSGGTEATAFNPRAVDALRRIGFQIPAQSGPNPIYEVHWGDEFSPIECFSKTFDHPINPKRQFVAIMTCSDADENCPFIPGAERRFALTYEDPKIADGTDQEAARYLERVEQIGRELAYLYQVLNEQ